MKRLFKLFAVVGIMTAGLMNFNVQAQSANETLKEVVKIMNQSCPQDMGTGLTMAKVVLANNNIVITITNDESVIPMATFNEMKSTLRPVLLENFAEGAKDPDFISLLKQTGAGMKFNIVGKKSQSTCDFTFTNKELLNAMM